MTSSINDLITPELQEILENHNVKLGAISSETDEQRDERMEREAVRLTRLHKEQEGRKIFNNSLGLPQSMSNVIFDDFETNRQEQIAVLNKAKEITSRVIKGETPNIIFTGKPGTGKTRLSISMANEILNNGKSVLYISTNKLVELKKDGFNDVKAQDRVNVLTRLIRGTDILILDDLGTETNMKDVQKATEFTQKTLFDIADVRDGKVNIITTNNNGTELTKTYNPKIVSKLLTKKSENVIQFNNLDDYRERIN